ncbi:ABC transporter substrate-binding protein [Marinactinospora rubrisoli]|uniref:ABC transporter substrate-binding protein n=1 Tax=Marinactinospora rubrisoli TaxID=2715399 RepID=A0ABW2KG72_9ACTN
MTIGETMPSSAPPRPRGGPSRTFAVVTALAALAAFPGCTVANSDAAGSTGTAGDTLRVVLAQEPPTLEPCEASLTSTGVVVRSNITEPLIERDPESGELEPLLATAWERTGPSTWSLDLRSGVTFHDGQEFTAEDAAFSIDRAVNSGLACNVDGYVFDGRDLEVEVTGDLSLSVTTEVPDPILPLRLSFIEVVPRTTSTEHKVREPVGTGPYVLDGWETGVSISLRRNDAYWGEPPAYPEARYVWRSEPSVRAAMITRGEADLATALNPEDATEDNSVAYPNNETVALRLDGREPPLDDIRVRRAIDMAVERDAIASTLLAGLAEPAAQLVPEGVVGHDPELRGTPTDPEAARELVAEAAADGAPIDRRITLVARNGMFPRVAETAEALQYQMAQLGLNVRIEMLDTAAHLQYQLRPLPENVGPVALLIMHGNQTGDAAFTASQYLLSEGAQSTFGTEELDAEIAAAGELSGADRQEALAGVLAHQNADVVQYAHVAHMRGLMGISPAVHYRPNSASGDELRLAEVRPAGREGS